MRTIAFLMVFLACAPVWAGAPDETKKPNVLFIVIETFRRDHAGCYGYTRSTTPVLDRIAAEGVKFERAISSSSWTMPSVMTMFTSVPPAVHNATTYKRRLAEGLTTLAAEFKKNGYQTAGIVSSPTISGEFGFNKGFDLYDDFTIVFDIGLNFLQDGDDAAQPPIQCRIVSDEVTLLAHSWLANKREPDKPFFLHLFYFDPHYDYVPPPPYDRMFTDPEYKGSQDGKAITRLQGKSLSRKDQEHIVGLYDGEICYTDEYVGRLFEELKKMGLYDNTIIVVTGDHGDEFWDHGGVAHGHTLYDELVWVPLVIRCPNLTKSGTVITNQVGLIDIMPTLLDLADLPIPAQCHGQSLRHLFNGEKDKFEDRPVFMEAEVEVDLKGVRTSTQKIVEKHQGAITAEMFALSDDPKEQRDLSRTDRAKEFDNLNKIFQDWKKRVQPYAEKGRTEKKPDLDPKLLKQLKSLGYVH